MADRTGKKSGKRAGDSSARVQRRVRSATPTSRKRVAPKAARPLKAADAQSAHMTASEKIDEKIASLHDWRGETLAQIRRLIHEVDPEVIEEWKWMGSPVWSHDGMYAVANAHKDKVKLTFFHGAELPDPGQLFNAGREGNKWRAIDFRAGDKIDTGALETLLREAVAYNTSHRVPKSKGSRATLLQSR
jgi:hypothetical protein